MTVAPMSSDGSLAALTALLRDARGIAHKRDIDAVMRTLGIGAAAAPAAVPVGDMPEPAHGR